MASSLSELLAQESFKRRHKSLKHQPDTHRSSNSRQQSRREKSEDDEDDNYIDEVTIKAVIAILSGYIARYAKDEAFREKIRAKCLSCLVEDDDEVAEKLETGIAYVDKLVERSKTGHKDARYGIQILSIVVASLEKTERSKPSLSACAQLYLAILYKHERNDGKSARHLLQAFCDAPFFVRTVLVPDLWEHFFLPHLLHLKVWYTKEVEFIADSEIAERRRKTQALLKAYDGQVDIGTVEFALYYKKLLKTGPGVIVGSCAVPVVPLPARPYRHRRRSMDTCSSTSTTTTSSVNNLYHIVFGSTAHRRQSSSFEDRSRASRELWGLKEEEERVNDFSDYTKHESRSRRRSSSQYERNPKTETWREPPKAENFRFFACQSLPLQLECSFPGNSLIKNGSVRRKDETAPLSGPVTRAIDAIRSSDSLAECELAVRVISRAWLDSAPLEAALSRADTIEGLLEVLFASEDDEVSELVLSLLAELVARNDQTRVIVLNTDPQLEIFRRHLRSSSLFLKAASVLFLVRPTAKQMVSVEWVPLVLRVMEFGDQTQTLFTIRCSPMAASFYLLNTLLTGFDEDRNMDNARQVVCLGGINLLAEKLAHGDSAERVGAAEFLSCCVKADGSCRSYLAESVDVGALFELVVLECRRGNGGPALSLVIEFLCLTRRKQVSSFLEKLKRGWNGLNTMQVLFAFLRRANREDRPLVAVTSLLLDLLGDPSEFSTYREEAVEAITEALNCQTLDEKVQEKTAKMLLILGGRFSHSGEPTGEEWLLEQAGFRVNTRQSLDTDTEDWQRKAAVVLLQSGGGRLLTGLSDAIADGAPSLSRASLATASWICMYLREEGDRDQRAMARAILTPRLAECLGHDRDAEERVIACFSLLNLTEDSDCVSMLSKLEKDQLVKHLKNLRLVTWTAEKLLLIIT